MRAFSVFMKTMLPLHVVFRVSENGRGLGSQGGSGLIVKLHTGEKAMYSSYYRLSTFNPM